MGVSGVPASDRTMRENVKPLQRLQKTWTAPEAAAPAHVQSRSPRLQPASDPTRGAVRATVASQMCRASKPVEGQLDDDLPSFDTVVPARRRAMEAAAHKRRP